MSEGATGAPAAPTPAPAADAAPQAEGQPSQSNQPPKQPSQKVKAKVYGREVDVTVDELVRDYQKYQASDRKFQEASRLMKEMDKLVESGKKDPKVILEKLGHKDPKAILKSLGIDPKEFAETLLIADIENEMLSPTERELKELKGKMKEREESEALTKKEREELAEKQRAEKAQAEAVEYLDSAIPEALAASGMKPTPRAIALIAAEMLRDLDALGDDMPEGYRPDARKAFGKVVQNSVEDLRTLMEHADPELIITKILPPALLEAIRKRDLAQVQKSRNEPPVRREEGQPPKKKVQRRLDDFFKDI